MYIHTCIYYKIKKQQYTLHKPPKDDDNDDIDTAAQRKTMENCKCRPKKAHLGPTSRTLVKCIQKM